MGIGFRNRIRSSQNQCHCQYQNQYCNLESSIWNQKKKKKRIIICIRMRNKNRIRIIKNNRICIRHRISIRIRIINQYKKRQNPYPKQQKKSFRICITIRIKSRITIIINNKICILDKIFELEVNRERSSDSMQYAIYYTYTQHWIILQCLYLTYNQLQWKSTALCNYSAM